MHIAITGRPGSGKSTLCRRIVEAFSGAFGGIVTEDVRDERGRRQGFEMVDVATGEREIFAHVHLKGRGPRVGVYWVNLDVAEGLGVAAIEHALEACEAVVVDEVALMELKSRKFVKAVRAVLDSDKPYVIAVHGSSTHALAARVRRESELVEVTPRNRDDLFEWLFEQLSE